MAVATAKTDDLHRELLHAETKWEHVAASQEEALLRLRSGVEQGVEQASQAAKEAQSGEESAALGAARVAEELCAAEAASSSRLEQEVGSLRREVAANALTAAERSVAASEALSAAEARTAAQHREAMSHVHESCTVAEQVSQCLCAKQEATDLEWQVLRSEVLECRGESPRVEELRIARAGAVLATIDDLRAELNGRLHDVDEQMLFLREEVSPDRLLGLVGAGLSRTVEQVSTEHIARLKRRWGRDVERRFDSVTACLRCLYAKVGLPPQGPLESLLGGMIDDGLVTPSPRGSYMSVT
eukprot:gnl/TRDRNA2_/TRDRNA2_114268_c0_seq1.p1 gnl/TRDRNA2_/TRDRNA2_114268_c0~~gnl/TRDRNA2_/TRDRNA2_114268_c0_seq1.p1  ORF type:complete len:321 (+),score=75.04 gnl/TRDRNA2_/TRDRNA2_114268_c0_seq1:66-965(+)